MTTALLSILGVLLGTWSGYRLSLAHSERLFRRTVLRDIAFEYRRLSDSRESGHVQGLIRSGICQCQNNQEYEDALNLVDDLCPDIPAGKDWRPTSGNFVEFFAQLKDQGIDPTNSEQMQKLKKGIDSL